jgi:serine/threonine protein kinase
MAVDLAQGVLIGGRYRLERCLGTGGMGAVWQAKHEVTGRRHALKFVTSRGAAPPELAKRFLREARAASTVDHPNVVHVADVFELDDGTPVMVMDLLEGETLAQRLSRDRKLPLSEVAELMLPVISAVGTAHAYAVVHRDLKPDNIFLAGGNGRPRVYVLDFGIAKLTEDGLEPDGTLTQAGTLLGTPRYMSPEQSFGERDIDHRTDLWSLGVILYEALSGSRPVEGENIAQVLKRLMNDGITPIEAIVDLPEEVSVLVGRLLSRDREQRPRDLREVFEVLRRYATIDAITFGPPASKMRGEEPTSGEERAPAAAAQSSQYEPAPSRRKPSFTLVAIVAALIGGVVLGIAVSSRSDSVDPPKSEPPEPAKHATPP